MLRDVGITIGLLLTAYTIWREERAQKIANRISIANQYLDITADLFRHPRLHRVMRTDVDLETEPITDEEMLHVKRRIIHLNTVYQAARAGKFVRVEGMRADIRNFFSLPIPRAVWDRVRDVQDEDFAVFVDGCLGET